MSSIRIINNWNYQKTPIIDDTIPLTVDMVYNYTYIGLQFLILIEPFEFN